jgi:hypothetical protein
MSENPLTLEEIIRWFRLREHTLAHSGVRLAEVRQRTEHLPSAAADFDAASMMGRISAWVSGEFDFEALRTADGKNVFFRHEKVATVDEASLEDAFSDFIEHMQNRAGSGGDDSEAGGGDS